MAAGHPGFRIFVLGAGFSRAAGLPVASELFDEVRSRIEHRHGRNTKFQRDVEHYLQYRHACDGVMLQEASLDLEDFMSFLDIEHFLQLRGSDTWSDDGNESQLMVRKGIGEVIHNRTPPADRLRPAYYQFADRLSPHDIVITFNYDIVLERALDYVGKPYRLFPDRFKSIGKYSNVVAHAKRSHRRVQLGDGIVREAALDLHTTPSGARMRYADPPSQLLNVRIGKCRSG